MPRNSNSKKAHSNHRHENGLVGPGKRITKQKSNGQLNGNPKGAPPDTPPLSPVLAANPLPNSSIGNASTGSLSESGKESTTLLRPAAVKQKTSESSLDNAESQPNAGTPPVTADNATKPRSDTTTSKRVVSSEMNPFQLASTILRSCPLYDTIAILILLLQLPPLVLTLVQALFASLTIVPPTGLSLGSLFSLFDVFQGSGGSPSLWTMIAVDTVFLGGWYCLWTWARNFALDLAQVQIAITLGGGNSGKAGGVNTFCVAIILVLHLFRSRGVRDFLFDYIFSSKVFTDQQIAQVAQYLPRNILVSSPSWPMSWLRSMFAIHIIAQASIAIVRRWLRAYETPAPLAKQSKRSDTEAGAGGENRPDSSAQEATPSSTSATGADTLPLMSPAGQTGKDRVMSLKKRRRQAHQVRSRQPFWAALASTKVTVMREYEHSKVPTSSPTTTAAAGRSKGEISEFMSSEESLVWISSICPSSIRFEASDTDLDGDSQDEDGEMASKPFYVRINGAYWTATTIDTIDEDAQDGGSGAQWRGEIAGLAPNCTYTCSFVKSRNDQEFCVVTVKTPALPDTDQSSTLASPPPRQLLRPSSPITTIKNSIATAEVKLAESRNRLTRSRRAHKASLAKVEKEVDSFTGRLKTSSDDTKQRQKLLQAERNMRQAEDATQSIEVALEDLASIPEEEISEWSTKKEEFEAQNALLAEANGSLEKARTAASTDIAAVNDDYKTLSARRERLTARQARLAEQHDRITQANAQGLNEKERKAGETAAKEGERGRVENSFLSQFAVLNREIQSLQVRTNQAWQEVQHFETAAQASLRNSNGPLTPEGPLPGTQQHRSLNNIPNFNPRSALGYSNAFNQAPLPAVTMSPEPKHASPFPAYAKPHQISSEAYASPVQPTSNVYNNAFSSTYRPRPRSSSGGNNSNFSADFEDADPLPPMPGNNSDFAELVTNGDRRAGSSTNSSRSANNGSPITNFTGGLGSPLRTGGRASPGQPIW